MTRLSLFRNELENEAIATRKMLAAVPDSKFDWKPHPKSMSIRQLIAHIAELPSWPGMVLNTKELDFAVSGYTPPEISDTASVINLFEQTLAAALESLQNGKEESLDEIWILRNGENIYSEGSKYDMIRISVSQIIHHRAQLGVFLRLLNVPIPGSYGPSADESF